MSGEMSDGRQLASEAMEAATLGMVFPDFIPAMEFYYKFQCDPGAMFAAGQKWLDLADELDKARGAAEDSTSPLTGETWVGSDHDAFEDKFGKLTGEIQADRVLAMTVGIALCTIAVLLYVRICVMLTMAVVIAALAAAFIAALAFSWTGVGAEVAADLFEAGNEVGEGFVTVMNTMNEALTAVENALAVGITGAMTGDVGFHLASGDVSVLGELGQAAVHGLGTEASGLLSMTLRNWTAKTFAKDPATGFASPTYARTIFAELNGVDGVDPVDWMRHALS